MDQDKAVYYYGSYWKKFLGAVGIRYAVSPRGAYLDLLVVDNYNDIKLELAHRCLQRLIPSPSARAQLTACTEDASAKPHPAVVRLFRHWLGRDVLPEQEVEALKTEAYMAAERTGTL